MTTSHAGRLAGTVSAVTGASSGIGAATARELAAAGSSVVLLARRAEQLQRLAEEITASGGHAVAAPGDICDPDAATRMVDRALETYGRLDFAVNNAGAPGRGAFLETSIDVFDRAMAVNYRGVLLAMRAELPALLRQGGAIVNVASVSGLKANPGMAAYVASKHALIGLTKSTALEFAPQGVRINAVAPGVTDTEMLSAASEQHRNFLLGHSALGRLSDPVEVAKAIIFLLVDATSSVGVTLPTDGGSTA